MNSNNNFPIIFDDVFSDSNMFNIYEEIVNINQWKYDVTSKREGLLGNTGTDKFWGLQLFNENTRYFNDITPFWVTQVLPYLDHRTNNRYKLTQHEMRCAHFNGQTYGQDGQFHSDHNITVFVQIGPIPWKKEWGGEFIQKNLNGEESIYTFEPGKCMIVDGKLAHKGMAPLIKDVLRVSLAIHLE